MKLVVELVRGVRRLALKFKLAGRLTHGREFVAGPRARVARGVRVLAGDRVSIGADFVTHDHVVIGDDVMISSQVAFIGNDHAFDDPTVSIRDDRSLPRATVRLEGDNLIGFGTIIIGDVTIGHGAIVGAGSLVTSDIPAQMIAVGRPARVVRARRET